MKLIKKKYFNNSRQVIHLKKGELLLEKGLQNHRLFLLQTGVLAGYDSLDESLYFEVKSGEFVGLHSFFSRSSMVQMSIIALQDSVVCYFEEKIYELKEEEANSITYDFMPLLLHLLLKRQKQMQGFHQEREQALKQRDELERLAALGELSAGVAHELNNAISVISRGSDTLSQKVFSQLQQTALEKKLLAEGLEKGRTVSSSESRKIAKNWASKSVCSYEILRDYARTGQIELLLQEKKSSAQRAYELWDLAATLHDLQIASKHSEHVVNSMKNLASQQVLRQKGSSINRSIEHALFLLSQPLIEVQLHLNLGELPEITINEGEWVQVWTNLIKNAIESMEQKKREESPLLIQTQQSANQIEVCIQDHGSGIPENQFDSIFQAKVTTKTEGKVVGLGLGLSIAQQIIQRYSGSIELQSTSAGSLFRIFIPIQKNT